MVFPEAAKYVIMNITFLSAPGAAVVMCMIMNEGKKKERNKEIKRHINTYGNILPTYGRSSLVLYFYSAVILLQMVFKISVCHIPTLCKNIVKPLSIASEGN